MNSWFEELAEQQRRAFQSLKEGKCGCHSCIEGRGEHAIQMVVCTVCGNKRCPKATDHNNECTNSNESGQKGSCYE